MTPKCSSARYHGPRASLAAKCIVPCAVGPAPWSATAKPARTAAVSTRAAANAGAQAGSAAPRRVALDRLSLGSADPRRRLQERLLIVFRRPTVPGRAAGHRRPLRPDREMDRQASPHSGGAGDRSRHCHRSNGARPAQRSGIGQGSLLRTLAPNHRPLRRSKPIHRPRRHRRPLATRPAWAALCRSIQARTSMGRSRDALFSIYSYDDQP